MSFRWVQGTINHATFPLVDGTDYASPESALSAAVKMWIYGKLLGNSALFFVNSGTGSLAGHDVLEVGPSKFGMYTIALGPNALSDASAMFYDQYIFMASATGAANQILLFSGVRHHPSDVFSTMNSQFAYVSNMLSTLSNYASNASNYFSSLSNVVSATLAGVTQTNSRVLLVQSQVSDILVDTAGLNGADVSDMASAVWAHAVGAQVNSRLLLVQSDAQYASGMLSAMSNILSQVLGDTSGLAGGDASDMASAVWAHAVGAQVNSRLVLVQSDAQYASAMLSNLSHIASQILGDTTGLNGATLSDIAAAVWAQAWTTHSAAGSFGSAFEQLLSRTSDAASATTQINSRVLLIQSDAQYASAMLSAFSEVLSDIYAIASDAHSAAAAGASASNIASAVWAAKWDIHSTASSFGSAFEQLVSRTSAAASAAQQANSRALLIQSDAQYASNMLSTLSTIASQILGDTTGLNGATVSDIASAVWAVKWDVHSLASSFGSAFEALLSHASNAASGVVQINSRVLLIQSDAQYASALLSGLSTVLGATFELVSDVESALTSQFTYTSTMLSNASAFLSDIRSDVSDMHAALLVMSNILSQVLGNTSGLAGAALSDIASAVWAQHWTAQSGASTFGSAFERLLSWLSDTNSATTQLNSRVFALSGAVSDVYTLLVAHSDVLSDIFALVSDVDSAATSQYAALSHYLSQVHSNLHSAVGNVSVAIGPSDISDIASATAAAIGFTPSAIASAVWAEKWDIHSNASSFGSAFEQLLSRTSDAASAAQQANSRVLLVQSDAQYASTMLSNMSGLLSDLYSLLVAHSDVLSDIFALVSDVDSALTSRFSDLLSHLDVTGVQLNASTMSALRSAMAGVTVSVGASDISDIASAVQGLLSDTLSTLYSAAQQTHSRVLVVQSRLSDLDGRVASDLSDLYSGVVALSGLLSDVDSALTSRFSDLLSLLTDTGVGLAPATLSDLRSAIGAVSLALTASDISDIASATAAAIGLTPSAIADQVWSDFGSKVGRGVSDAFSDLLALAAAVAAVESALTSQFAATSASLSDVYALVSDVDSALTSQFAATTSQMAGLAEQVSDMDSALQSQFAATSGMLSDLSSQMLWLSDTTSNIYSVLTTVRAEPAPEEPAATDTPLKKLDWLYTAWRNKKANDGDSTVLYADNEDTPLIKQATTEAGGVVTKAEWDAGG